MKVSYAAVASYRPPKHAWPGWSTFGQSPAAYDPEVGGRAMEQGLAEARHADAAGLDWISVSEHHYGPFTLTPNPMVWAAAVAQHVPRAKIALLGPVVSINNPLRVAEEIAMLDSLTGGRVVVLFLRGTPNEFATYHVHPADTRARTQEASLLITRALTETRPFGWEGRFFRYRHVSVWPGCVQRPHPPLFSSGNSLESATFAARHRHGLALSFMGPEDVARVVHHYREEAARNGWEPSRDHVLWRHWAVVAGTDRDVRRESASYFGAEAPLFIPPPPPDSPEPRHTIHTVGMAGTPDAIVRQIQTLHDVGVGVVDMVLSYGYTSHESVMRAIELLGLHVVPGAHQLDAADARAERPNLVP